MHPLNAMTNAARKTGTGRIEDHYSELERILNRRRDEIIGLTELNRGYLDEQLTTPPGDAADLSVTDTNASYFMGLVGSHQRELQEIAEAIEKIHRGAYGFCESCENEIALERLRHLPTARLCVTCQSAAESRRSPSRLRAVPKA
jgi:DnaK suppressor protein